MGEPIFIVHPTVYEDLKELTVFGPDGGDDEVFWTNTSLGDFIEKELKPKSKGCAHPCQKTWDFKVLYKVQYRVRVDLGSLWGPWCDWFFVSTTREAAEKKRAEEREFYPGPCYDFQVIEVVCE